MEINSARPATVEVASLSASDAQATRFKERKQREAQSDVRNEAVYFSPVVRIDRETQSAVIQYRDQETGEVLNQYPNKGKASGAYQQAQDSAPSEEREIKVVRAPAPEQTAKVEEPKAKEIKVDEKA